MADNGLTTAERLRELLDYDAATGVFTWRERDDVPVQWNGKHAGKIAGTPASNGYTLIKIGKKGYGAHRLAWFYMTGELPHEIDHINGVKDDNRFINLRLATRSQNNVNKGPQKNSATGVKGVARCRDKFKAQAWVDGRMIHLGVFETIEEARSAHVDFYVNLHGEFARIT